MTIEFRFNFEKTLQAAAFLLSQEKDRRMSSLRLLKLLYVADREMLAATGKTITGDHAVAMKNGPVLSKTYNLILGQSPRADHWSPHIRRDGYKVELVTDPGKKRLSRGETGKLLELTERYRSVDDWALSESTHDFAEWKDTFPGGNAAAPIPWEAVLQAQGRGDLVAEVERDASDAAFFDRLFGGQP